jgi:hypothetical protein
MRPGLLASKSPLSSPLESVLVALNQLGPEIRGSPVPSTGPSGAADGTLGLHESSVFTRSGEVGEFSCGCGKGSFSGTASPTELERKPERSGCGRGGDDCLLPGAGAGVRDPTTYLASGAAAAAGGCQSSVTGLFRSAPKASSRQRSPALTGGVSRFGTTALAAGGACMAMLAACSPSPMPTLLPSAPSSMRRASCLRRSSCAGGFPGLPTRRPGRAPGPSPGGRRSRPRRAP